MLFSQLPLPPPKPHFPCFTITKSRGLKITDFVLIRRLILTVQNIRSAGNGAITLCWNRKVFGFKPSLNPAQGFNPSVKVNFTAINKLGTSLSHAGREGLVIEHFGVLRENVSFLFYLCNY